MRCVRTVVRVTCIHTTQTSKKENVGKLCSLSFFLSFFVFFVYPLVFFSPHVPRRYVLNTSIAIPQHAPPPPPPLRICTKPSSVSNYSENENGANMKNKSRSKKRHIPFFEYWFYDGRETCFLKTCTN